MTIRFTPLGIPFSSSFSVLSSFTLQTTGSRFPVTSSYAEFALFPVGPSGSNGTTVSGSVP